MQLCRDYANAGTYCLELHLHLREQISWLETTLSAARRLKDRRGEGAALGNLGSAYFNLKDYLRARAYYTQQRAIAKDIGDRFGEGNALLGLATCFVAEQDISHAIAHAQAALDIFLASEWPHAQTMRDLLAE